MPTILRKRPSGKRFEYITKEELDDMLMFGTARKLGMMPSYEEVNAPKQEEPPEPKTYDTKELRAEEPKPQPQQRRTSYRKTGSRRNG